MSASVSQKKEAALKVQAAGTQSMSAERAQPTIIWEMQAYQKQGDDLVAEWPLKGISVETLHSLFEQPEDDPMYDAYPVNAAQMERLQAYTDHPIDLQTYDYFVQCYAE